MQNSFASLHWILPSLGMSLELPKNILAGSKLILPCVFTQHTPPSETQRSTHRRVSIIKQLPLERAEYASSSVHVGVTRPSLQTCHRVSSSKKQQATRNAPFGTVTWKLAVILHASLLRALLS